MTPQDYAGLIFIALFGWALLRPLFTTTTDNREDFTND